MKCQSNFPAGLSFPGEPGEKQAQDEWLHGKIGPLRPPNNLPYQTELPTRALISDWYQCRSAYEMGVMEEGVYPPNKFIALRLFITHDYRVTCKNELVASAVAVMHRHPPCLWHFQEKHVGVLCLGRQGKVCVYANQLSREPVTATVAIPDDVAVHYNNMCCNFPEQCLPFFLGRRAWPGRRRVEGGGSRDGYIW